MSFELKNISHLEGTNEPDSCCRASDALCVSSCPRLSGILFIRRITKTDMEHVQQGRFLFITFPTNTHRLQLIIPCNWLRKVVTISWCLLLQTIIKLKTKRNIWLRFVWSVGTVILKVAVALSQTINILVFTMTKQYVSFKLSTKNSSNALLYSFQSPTKIFQHTFTTAVALPDLFEGIFETKLLTYTDPSIDNLSPHIVIINCL